MAGSGGGSQTRILNDILFQVTGADKSKRALEEVESSLDAIWSTADQANQGINDLIATMQKLKTSTKNIATQNNNSVINNFSAAAGTSMIKTKNGTAYAYNPNNRRDQDKADQVHNQVLKQEQEQLRIMQETTALMRERKNKLALETQNYQQILDNQTKYADAAYLSAQNAKARNASVNARNLAYADYKNKRNTNEWVDASLADMRTRTAYRQFRMDNPYANGSYKRSFRYQAGMGLINAGSYIGRHLSPPIANALSSVAQIGGAALSNPFMAANIGIQQITKAIVDLGQASVKAYGQIDSLKTQMGVVYGNDTQANVAFGQIAQYATKSPFGVEETTELATLLKQSGVEASNLMDTLKMLGDTAGGNMEKMKRIANNYAQIVSIGKASMLDMRQFAYAGIPIFEKVSEELGVSQTALRKMISDGKVTSEVIQKVFKDMTSEGGLFFEATSKGAETLKARLQNLKDTKQLALAGIGESFLRFGEKNGNDSIATKGITLSEKTYGWLETVTSIKNLERSVKSIENNTSEQARIKDLIEYYKKLKGLSDKEAKKDPIIQRLYEQLELASNIYNPDKQRSIYSQLYKSYRGDEKATMSLREIFSNVDNAVNYTVPELVSAYNTKISKSESDRQYRYRQIYNDTSLTKEQKDIQNKAVQEYYDKQKALLELELENKKYNLEIILAQKNITGKEQTAWYETKTIESQQESVDYLSEMGKRSASVLNDLSTIQSMYEQTDKYKEEQAKLEEDRLKKSLKLLKEAKGYADKDGIIDFTKVNGSRLLSLINSGAVTGRKLATVMDAEGADTDWERIRNQTRNRADEILKNAGKYGNAADLQHLAQFSSNKQTNLLYKDATSVYKHLNDNYDLAVSEMQELADKSEGEVKKFWEDQIKIFSTSLLEVMAETGKLDYDIDELNKSKKTFIPLWKRIIQAATGIDHTAISDVKSALGFYSQNLSTRSMTGNTLTALAKEGLSVDAVRQLTSARTIATNLKEDNRGKVWQIDWDATRKGMTDFVSKLSASTTAIDTWTSGLEAERDVYANLLGSGILTQETNGVDKAMYLTDKKLLEGWTSTGEMGVNAFGEELRNADGKIVSAIKDGIALDEKGNPLENQTLVITDKIYTVLQEHLINIDKEIREANKVAAKNSTLASMQGNILPSYLSNLGMKGAGYGLSNYIMSNPEAYQKWFSQNLNITGYNNQTELMSAYFNGDKDAVQRVNEALKTTNSEVLEFINTDLYTNLKKYNDNLEKINNINSGYNTVLGLMSGTEAYNPYRLKGKAGYKYRWGEGEVLEGLGISGVTIEDLMSEAEGNKASKINELNNLSIKSINGTATEDDKARIKALQEEIKLTEELTEAKMRELIADKAKKNVFEELNDNVREIAKTTAKKAFVQPFETLGEDMFGLLNHTKEFDDTLDSAIVSMEKIAGEMVSNIGTEMQTAGWRIVQAAALESNWAGVAGGLALAGAGGLAAGLGKSLSDAQTNKKNETEKLQSLTDQIKALLEQARNDALYYENNLRHKEALGNNSKYTQKVNDAIITPNGNVITTAPDDYLIATKQPQNLVSRNASPTINFTVVDNAGVNVKQQKKQNADGSVEIIAIIENVVGDYIASEKGDSAFNARENRMRGHSYIM